jgi:hypothetical protein
MLSSQMASTEQAMDFQSEKPAPLDLAHVTTVLNPTSLNHSKFPFHNGV